MKLNYKASNIAKAEQETGLNFFNVISGLGNGGMPSFSTILFLFKAGGATEEEFDASMKNGIENALKEAMEAFAEAGFLGSSMTKEEVQKMFEAEAKKAEQKTQ